VNCQRANLVEIAQPNVLATLQAPSALAIVCTLMDLISDKVRSFAIIHSFIHSFIAMAFR